jgi:ATP-dependent Clp endopeptidase proteolytic subunit ClpP
MKPQKTAQPWYEIRNVAAGEAEIWLYSEIGDDIWGDGSSTPARTFVEELAALGDVSKIALHINSPGGSVFDGQAIYTVLKNHKATITSYVDGLAASIASVIALAGERVIMAANALFMIHDPFGLAVGNSADMRKMADVLDKVGTTIAGVYEDKTGLYPDEVHAAMAAESWYSAEEALALGYVDEVAGAVDLAACAGFDLGVYRHVPEQLLAAATPVPEPATQSQPQDPPAEGAPSPSAEDTSRQARPLVPGTLHPDHP